MKYGARPALAELGNFFQAAFKAARIFDVMHGTHLERALLIRSELTHHLGRAAHDHGAVGKFLTLGH